MHPAYIALIAGAHTYIVPSEIGSLDHHVPLITLTYGYQVPPMQHISIAPP